MSLLDAVPLAVIVHLQRIEAAQPARSKLRETLLIRAKAMEQQRVATPQ